MSTSKTYNILVVEDQLGDVHLIKMAAEAWPSVVLYTVPNAVQAHQFVLRKAPFEHVPIPDLILLDLRMPIYDGSTVLATVIGKPEFANCRVVVFTSSRLLSDQSTCKKLGAHDYVNKPTEWPAWKATIRDILHKHLKGFGETT